MEDQAPPPAVDKLEEFNASWEAMLSDKAAQEAEAEQGMQEQARADLAQLNAEREELRDRNTTRNRELERALCEQIDNDIEGNGNSWERVTKLVDLQLDHTATELDTSRMRQIFIQMKNTTA